MKQERIVRLPEVCRLTGLSRSTVYRRVIRGDFPPPLRLGGHAVGWRLSEVQGWISTRPLARSGGSSAPGSEGP